MKTYSTYYCVNRRIMTIHSQTSIMHVSTTIASGTRRPFRSCPSLPPFSSRRSDPPSHPPRLSYILHIPPIISHGYLPRRRLVAPGRCIRLQRCCNAGWLRLRSATLNPRVPRSPGPPVPSNRLCYGLLTDGQLLLVNNVGQLLLVV